jgi:non-specific serine/threonine protein kinase/serine/threonine-protein kinase
LSGTDEKNDKQTDRDKQIPTADFADLSGPDGWLDCYKLLSVLGEGGFAVVYLAEQKEPVKRRVALKVIKPGMDTKQVIARFEAERQALALLEHPNIAHVYDAGTTKTGRPYFVMEYVKGIPVKEHCDRHKLPIEERLNLFLQICEAIQYAHQKGIIHRDIKSSNILVSLEDKNAVPKVIDFGIAKAISQPLTERTLHTELGQLIGTPEFMSPEQAEMTGQDIDTRTDVYSLGVVLYELLTGTLPFDSETLRAGGPDNIRKIIREQDPKPPSTRLRGFTREQLAAVGQSHRVEPHSLHRKIRGDLDWITLKAMDKDRTRRYGSVGEFMADINRHLNCEPVVAGPPSTIYRLRKFIRRNKAVVTGMVAVLIVLVAGIIATTSFAIRAERQRQVSQSVVNFLNNDLLELVDPNKARGQEVSVRYILDGASRNLKGKFKNEPHVEASIRKTLGKTYIKLGEWRLAQPHFERIVTLNRQYLGENDPDTLNAMSMLAQIYLIQVRYEDAQRLSANVLEIRRRRYGEGDPSTLSAVQQLAYIYICQRRYGQAEPLLKEALDTSRRCLGEDHIQTVIAMCGLSNLYYFQGKMDDARSLLVEALEVCENLDGEQREMTMSLTTAVAVQYAQKDRYEEAQAMIARALQICRRTFGEEHQVTLNVMSTQGLLFQMQGRYDEAEQLIVQVLATSRRVLGEEHLLTIKLIERLGLTYIDKGLYVEAEPLLLKYQQIRRERLGENHPLTIASIKTLIRLYEAWDKPEKVKQWRAKLPTNVNENK